MSTPDYFIHISDSLSSKSFNIFKSLFLTTLGLIITGLFCTSQPAQAQTPVTEVKDSGGEIVFQVFDDGALLGLGTQGTGTIPATGAGTRMMWYPAKAAFRAGQVTGNQWDDSNIGQNSIAAGSDTKASGSNSVAIGSGTEALTDGAVALGTNSSADGAGGFGIEGPATAIGASAEATTTEATAIGKKVTASGDASTAIGLRNTASGQAATAIGKDVTASGNFSLAIGRATVAATPESFSTGAYNNANQTSDNTLFVIGNGSSGSRSDALVLDTSGNMTISGNLTESSDRRLKKAIQPLGKNILNKLSNIRPVQFKFKNRKTHPSGKQIGIIAQEVQKYFPELVSKDASGYLSVAYPKFTAVLLKGMHEQQKKIAELENKTQRIAALEQKVDEMNESRQRAGLPLSSFALLAAGIVIGGLFWRKFGSQPSYNSEA